MPSPVHMISRLHCQQVQFLRQIVRYNSNKAAVTKINRHIYPRMYNTVLVQPDGSTYNIRYKEPRSSIKLPLDLNTLTEEERVIRLARRKPKQKLIIEEEIEDNFDADDYSKYFKQ